MKLTKIFFRKPKPTEVHFPIMSQREKYGMEYYSEYAENFDYINPPMIPRYVIFLIIEKVVDCLINELLEAQNDA